MRLNRRVVALCVALLVNQGANAGQLPQRWVSAGGGLSEWISALGAQSWLVVADRALSGEAARAALFKDNPTLLSTRAARDGRVIDLDPTLLVGGLGPRLPQSLVKLADGFYPVESAMTP